MKTKRPKIEIGTTFPYWHEDRYVNAEVVRCIKFDSRNGLQKRNLWIVRLTESQQPIVHAWPPEFEGKPYEFQADTRSIGNRIVCIDSLPHYAPRHGSCVVQYVEFPGDGPAGGLWCEIRDQHKCGGSQNTHWDRSEYETVEALLASGDATEVVA